MAPAPTDLPSDLGHTLGQLRARAGRVVFLTGAGISAESGVPTFRGEEGFWTVGSRHYRAMELATARAFARMPQEVWRWYLYRRTICRAAPPNGGHHALVRAEQALGERFALVTQNVDGLHLRAGNSLARTRQIHGNIDFMRCLHDGGPQVRAIPEAMTPHGKDDPFTAQDRTLLSCPGGGLSRPHVLWFDEFYDEPLYAADTALRDAERADLLVVVGTAGTTNLPRQIATIAIQRGIPFIDINPQDNPFAEAASQADQGWALTGSASQWLPPIVAHLAGSVSQGDAS